MITSIHIYSPELYLMIASGILLVFTAIRPIGFGKYTMFEYIQRVTMYILIITAILIWQMGGMGTEEGLLFGRTEVTNMVGIVVTVGGAIYSKMKKEIEQELGVLVIFAIIGMLIIIGARDLLMLYMGIELQSLTMYVLATIKRNGEYSTEAGLKYFILGAVSSGMYLLGCAYIYIQTGHTDYGVIMEQSGLGIGTIFIMIALLWKIGAAPLHMWVPDVYEGAPSHITAFFAIIPKISIVLGIITLITGPFISEFENIQILLIISAILSTMFGALGGLNQTKFKRILAYSAISHTGFILSGVLIGSLQGIIASLIYMVIYIGMSFITFTFIVTNNPGSNNHINLLVGISRNNRILAITIAIVLLSLAGVPPLAGFLSKYLILVSTIQAKLYFLTIMAILSSLISAFYYVRLIKYMFFKESTDFSWKVLSDISSNYFNRITLSASLIISTFFFFVITIVIYPQPLILVVSDAVLTTLV